MTRCMARTPAGWRSNELKIGDNVRIAPYGQPNALKSDGSAYTAARLPHYHVKQAPKPNNNTARTSQKWHRPWETLLRKFFK